MKAKQALSAILIFAISNCARGDTFGSGPNTFNIDFVTIGNPGNAPDTTGKPNPAGSVPYTFRMGKYEISEQMVHKASTLGGLGFTKDLRGPDRPAVYVTWNEAARFVNWLNISTGSPPAYKFAFQPGDAGYNSNANIQLWIPSDPGYDPSNLYRNRLARYVLPSDNEWYKAAYYDPTSGVYYDYPTGSNSAPTRVASGTAPGTAVYDGELEPADITQAGGLSPYGTMAQGGNAYEWEETNSSLVNDGTGGRGIRGGWWVPPASFLSSSSRSGTSAVGPVNDYFGFRVASIDNVPEPSTALLVGIVAFACGFLRRRYAD